MQTHYENKHAEKEDILDKVHNIFTGAIDFLFKIINLIFIVVIGVFLHLLDFAPLKLAWEFVWPRIVLFLAGAYLTLLPTSIVVLLLLIPVRFSFPIVIISSFFSFFILFAI